MVNMITIKGIRYREDEIPEAIAKQHLADQEAAAEAAEDAPEVPEKAKPVTTATAKPANKAATPESK